MRRLDLVDDFITTERAINYIISLINEKILEFELRGEKHEIVRGFRFCKNKLIEILTDLKFTNLLKEINNITVSDIDRLIHKDGKLIMGIELKTREEYFKKYFPVNASQYILLRDFKAKLNIPLFYVVKLPKGQNLIIELQDGWKIIKHDGNRDLRGSYALAPVDQGMYLKDSELKRFLSDKIREGN
jgi:hypothetical protein